MFKRKVKQVDVDLPTGSVVSNQGQFFYIKGDTRLTIGTKRILDSWRFDRIIEVTDDCIARYRPGGRMGFREGTVIKDIATSEIFLISGGQKCKIMSPDTLDNLSMTNIVVVSHDEAGIHVRGEDL